MRVPSLLAATASLALVVAAGIAMFAARPGAPSPGVPRVHVDAPGLTAMLAANRHADVEVKGHFADELGTTTAAKLARRGFSPWHHGAAKPSLRVEQPPQVQPQRPRHIELSRPEDPLGLANLLPDRLAAELGLLHAGTEAVELWLAGGSGGVYLRSLRPGDDLAAARGRGRGTFWKGDALGERRHENLWTNADAWRSSGRTTARSRARLEQLLAVLREPASPTNTLRLRFLLDTKATARAMALATLVGSNHADRAHNHVWFDDPVRDAIEPMLWDANAFGMHAEPTLPVDLTRHPLADRLVCDPVFLHQRDLVLWELLHGFGSPERLVAFATQQLATLRPVLDHDPEIARLVLRRGEFQTQRVDASEVDGELAAFAQFVQQRAAFLRDWLSAARVATAVDPADPACTRVSVFGNVAVTVARTDQSPVLAAEGHEVSLLLPGRTAARFAEAQRTDQDGTGVQAPHARPAPLHYALRGKPDDFVFSHALTQAPLRTTTLPADSAAAAAAAAGSVHPWALPEPPATITFGPGFVRVDASAYFAASTTVVVAAGTRLRFARNATWHCRGPLRAIGTEAAPIAIEGEGGEAPLRCSGAARFLHVHLHGPTTPLLALHGSAAELRHVTLRGAVGNGLEVDGGTLDAQLLDIALCRGHGLQAAAGTRVQAIGSRFAWCDHGVWVRDAAIVTLQRCELQGNMVGAFAEGAAAPFAGGTLALDHTTCRDNGRLDVDAGTDGVVTLRATVASTGRGVTAAPAPVPGH